MDKIIYFTESSGYGGAEKYLLDSASHAKSIGKDVTVAFPHRAATEKFEKALNHEGIRVADVKQPRGNYIGSFSNAKRFFLEHEKGIIHFTLPFTDICRWAILAAASLKRKYFITELSGPPDPFKSGVYFLAVAHLPSICLNIIENHLNIGKVCSRGRKTSQKG